MGHIAEKGCASEFHHGLVHKPTTIKEAMKMPGPSAVVDEDWKFKKVTPKADVVQQAQKEKTSRLIVSLMESLPSEALGTCQALSKVQREWGAPGGQRHRRQRVQIFFSEQGASASLMPAATLLNTVSRLPLMAREANGACSISIHTSASVRGSKMARFA